MQESHICTIFMLRVLYGNFHKLQWFLTPKNKHTTERQYKTRTWRLCLTEGTQLQHCTLPLDPHLRIRIRHCWNFCFPWSWKSDEI